MDEDGDKGPDRKAVARMCIVTREVRPIADLIRFVAGPDGELVPDIKARLPGRGVWVTASAGAVEAAERKKLFGRAFEGPVAVAPGLAGRVEARLRDAAIGALSLARKVSVPRRR